MISAHLLCVNCSVSRPESQSEEKSNTILTVSNGGGSGTYSPNEEVFIDYAGWTDYQAFLGWNVTPGLEKTPQEWIEEITLPSVNTNFTPRTRTLTARLQENLSYQGYARTKYYHSIIPAKAKGLVILIHGTSGSREFIKKTNAWNFTLRLVANGFGVVSTDAEEIETGDINGDGKIRWNPSLSNISQNPDFRNIQALISKIRSLGQITSSTPILSVGMSNGGSFSIALGASNITKTAVSYCASGRTDAIEVTTAPTAWFLCLNDETSDNDESIERYNELKARNIPSKLVIHAIAPLTPSRLMRITGLRANDLYKQVHAELDAHGYLNQKNFLTASSSEIIEDYTNNPQSFPVFQSLSSPQRSEVMNQIRVCEGAHEFYDDLAAETIEFLNTHL